jgi:hypothetical protein
MKVVGGGQVHVRAGGQQRIVGEIPLFGRYKVAARGCRDRFHCHYISISVCIFIRAVARAAMSTAVSIHF